MAEIDPSAAGSQDPVRRLIERANALLAGGAPGVGAFLNDVESLSPRELVRFDEQSRSLWSGVSWSRLPGLRGAEGLWHVLALVSGDGHQREQAARTAPFSRLTVRLLALRCVDWVAQVRDAALARLEACPSGLLLEALPLAEQLARERMRGDVLDGLLDARLANDDLRNAFSTSDPLTRRAAWRRLAGRGAATAQELRTVAARDADVMVRAVAVRSLDDLADDDKRALAEVLVRDPVGWIAVPALGALVALDGTPPILAALTAPTAPLRRAARDWAAIRDVDARAVYVEFVKQDPRDARALTSLAEMGDRRDGDLFRRMLNDERSRVRAAGLRGLARVDRPAARRAAVGALQAGATGRVTWAATDVLHGRAPTGGEIELLTRAALDPARTPGQRFRILSLLRPARWTHLAVLLEFRNAEDDQSVRRRLDMEVRGWVASSRRISRAPDADVRARIERLLPTLDATAQREIGFVLRTSA